MKTNLAGSIALLIAIFVSNSLFAQTEERQDNPPSIGIEGGWMQNRVSGYYIPLGNDIFQGGKGSGSAFSALVELPINSLFSHGAKVGVNVIATSQTMATQDSVLVYSSSSKNNPVYMPVNEMKTTDISLAYLTLSYFFTYRPFGSGMFLQVDPTIGLRLQSHYANTTVLNDIDHTYPGGEKIQTIGIEIPAAADWRILVKLMAAYEFHLPSGFTVSPEVSYDLPITRVLESDQLPNPRVSSLAFTMGLKYDLR